MPSLYKITIFGFDLKVGGQACHSIFSHCVKIYLVVHTGTNKIRHKLILLVEIYISL